METTNLNLSTFNLQGSRPCPSRETELQRRLEDGHRAAVRLQMQNKISVSLTLEDSPQAVMPAILETMCAALGWQWGALWELGPDGSSLVLTSVWHAGSPWLQAFEEASRVRTMCPGDCLAGAVLSRGAVWEPHFPERPSVRADAARSAGLHAAFAFPVALGSRTLAVVELLSEGASQPDPDLLETLKATGYMVARRLERWRSREQLAASERRYRLMFESNPMPLLIVEYATNRFLAVNTEAERVYGFSNAEFQGMTLLDLLPPGVSAPVVAENSTERYATATRHRRANGDWMDVELSAYGIPWDGHAALLLLANDVTARNQMQRERESMELQLRSAQRLESIGSLAAGVAHEINTPTQYVGDNVRFVGEAIDDLLGLVDCYQGLTEAAASVPELAALARAVAAKREEIDWDYLRAEIPQAIEQTLAGIQQVSSIVRSMKEFSHPGQQGKTLVDLNRAALNTVGVSRNEWKYVAELTTDLDPNLPQIPCLGGEINQVLLNLIVNAAHAIGDENQRQGREKGHIRVRTRSFPNSVEIQVEDDGGGIPASIGDRVFDPFFTTKVVGRGTGQGLAIARTVVVDKHGGSLCFETREGVGTTFYVQLPSRDQSLVGDVLDLSLDIGADREIVASRHRFCLSTTSRACSTAYVGPCAVCARTGSCISRGMLRKPWL